MLNAILRARLNPAVAPGDRNNFEVTPEEWKIHNWVKSHVVQRPPETLRLDPIQDATVNQLKKTFPKKNFGHCEMRQNNLHIGPTKKNGSKIWSKLSETTKWSKLKMATWHH